MGFVVDFSQLEDYVKNMKVSQRDFESFLSGFLLRMAGEVVKETKLKQSGHYGDEFKAYDTGAMTNAWKLGNIHHSGKDLSVEILNAMEYATEIEFGRPRKKNGVEVGWINGHFMMTTSIEHIQKQMPAAYEVEFSNFCRSHGIA